MISNLFGDHSSFDVFQFPTLHTAYPGIAGEDLDQAMRKSTRYDLNSADGQGRTVLPWAAQRGNAKVVAQLLASGVDPNKAARDGWTPLQWSTKAPDSRAMELLLAAKADLEAVSCTGQTALHSVARYAWLECESLNCLLRHGADLEKKNDTGMILLADAVYHDNHVIFKGLVENGASIHTRMKWNHSLLHLALLRNSHATLGLLVASPDPELHAATDDGGCYVSHHAGFFADIESLNMLAEKWPSSIDLTKETSDGWTTWELAGWRRRYNTEWSRQRGMTQDDDPCLCYEAFERMVSTIQQRWQHKLRSEVEDERQDIRTGHHGSADEEASGAWDDVVEYLDA